MCILVMSTQFHMKSLRKDNKLSYSKLNLTSIRMHVAFLCTHELTLSRMLMDFLYILGF
jgi:hypothetical protein